MNVGRTYWLWRLAKLQVLRKRGCRRVATSGPRPLTAMNRVRSYDFVFDRVANGEQLKCLTVTDGPKNQRRPVAVTNLTRT